MDNVKILVDGIQKDVYGIFYIYDSKYYFIYTEKELDENDYVIFYASQVGKETKNTENGPVDTGYMVGIEVVDPEEQTKVQTSISYIVEDKKNNSSNSNIQYLPMSMLSNLKIISKKRFRLLKSVVIDSFNLRFDNELESIKEVPEAIVNPILTNTEVTHVNQTEVDQPVEQPIVAESLVEKPIVQTPIVENTVQVVEPVQPVRVNDNSVDNVIIDYRSKYFEEEEKNKELQEQIDILTKKLEDIKQIIG